MNDWFNETHQTCIKRCCEQIRKYNTAGNTPIETNTEHKLNYTTPDYTQFNMSLLTNEV